MSNKIEIPTEYLGHKRDQYLTNEDACMLTACLWAKRSKDPSTQVGACFVNHKGRIISVGYNGTPNGWNDDEFPWDKGSDLPPEYTKYPYVIHAEKNGIYNYDGSSTDFIGSTLYVTLFPCSDCAKALVQRGIKKVIYLSDKYNNTSDNLIAKKILDTCGVEYIEYDKLNENNLHSLSLYTSDDLNNRCKLVKKYVPKEERKNEE